MGKLKIVVIYDRVLVDDDEETLAAEKAPVTRTLDKKEVEEEVAETLVKLGHEPIMHEIDGTTRSLLALAKLDCDLVFNLCESFGDDDTADFKIAGFLELLKRKYTGAGTHGLLLAQDKATAKKIFAFHGVHTPVFAKSYRGRLDFSHDLHFPVIVKPAREDGSIGIEFSAVVSSIKELMERMDWLHQHFDSPVLIEEYIEGREMYVGIIGNAKPEALPIIELDLSKLPEGTPRIAGDWPTKPDPCCVSARRSAATSWRVRFFSCARSMIIRRRWGSMGFSTKSYAPCRMASTAASIVPRPVRRITGTSGASSRRARSSHSPSMLGMTRSLTMTSKWLVEASSRAWWPSQASSTR